MDQSRRTLGSSQKKVTFDDPRQVYQTVNSQVTSLAGTNSLLRKNPSKLNKESLGMNPNMRIENEYIENLLKQIHFMNMEVNLLKEKMEDDKGRLGPGWDFESLNAPTSKHIVSTQDKLKALKTELDNLEYTNKLNLIRLTDKQVGLEKAKDYIDHVHENANNNFVKLLESLDKRVQEIKVELNRQIEARGELEDEIAQLQAKLDKSLGDNRKLSKEKRVRELYNTITLEEHKDDEDFDIKEITILDKILEGQLKEKEDLEAKINSNKEYQELLSDNKKLLAEKDKREKDLNELQYKLLEMETLQSLAVKHKEQEAEERKKMLADIEKLKDLYHDTFKANNMKVQRKMRDVDSPELNAVKGELMKVERELRELQAKVDAFFNKYKNDREDQLHKEIEFGALKADNAAAKAENDGYLDTLKTLEPENNKIAATLDAMTQKYEALKKEKMEKRAQLNRMKADQIEMIARCEYFRDNLDVEEALKNINIEELRVLLKTNSTVNNTIDELFKTWDNIKKFAKETKPEY
eukprot:TRINITY_DN5501_c0_g2_i1.p2 TRINITY_DN5501_c0_g2~~TRINITY_DN5501_c0_g2_i1.p2  ORF type:complete len:524 (-),score=214.41 TRINITY_DN5501_c0_g2_i1:1690-3261(-)